AATPATELACNDDIVTNVVRQSQLTFNATAGQSYLILVGDFSFLEGVIGNLKLNVQSAANRTPTAVSVSPGAGSGLSQPFTFTFSDLDGRQDLNVLNVLINNGLDGGRACYMAYVVASNTLYLLSDDGGTLLTPGLVLNGSGGVTSNSQCTINGTGSSVGGSGTTLTFTVNISFSGGFTGNKIVYLAARDQALNNSGWQALGTWGVPGFNTAPTAVSANPSRGSGTSQVFAFAFSDTKGVQDFGVINILINNSLDGRQACYLAYSSPSQVLYLVTDPGNGLSPPLTLNSTGAISNSQCTVSSAGSSVNISGNTLTLRLNISFSAAFNGNRVMWLAARDGTGANNSGWQSLGSWTVQ
ncbi:MAG TPA: hypothetical protein VGH38_11810, partial [Bryobacteraceae bacterium]